MMLERVVPILASAAVVLAACASEPPSPPEPMEPAETMTMTRDVPPPLPEGRPATVCLATGQEVQIHLSPGGDTLVGPDRVALRELRGLAFAGDYAADEPWFNRGDAIAFDDRRYEKFGTERSMGCDALEIIGAYNGVNLFAEAIAQPPYATIYSPARPGVFQAYRAGVSRVRG